MSKPRPLQRSTPIRYAGCDFAIVRFEKPFLMLSTRSTKGSVGCVHLLRGPLQRNRPCSHPSTLAKHCDRADTADWMEAYIENDRIFPRFRRFPRGSGRLSRGRRHYATILIAGWPTESCASTHMRVAGFSVSRDQSTAISQPPRFFFSAASLVTRSGFDTFIHQLA